jgi:hypothetical protein
VPALSVPTGVTFDTLRNRLILSSLGAEGYLYAYAPESQQWSVISSLYGKDIQAPAYMASEDRIYAVPVVSGDAAFSSLMRFDATGNYLGDVALSELIPPAGSFASRSYQLLVDGDRLMLLAAPCPDWDFPELPAVQRAYVIDPTTGDVTYLGAFPADVPEPATGALLALSSALTLRRPPHKGRKRR